jgi:hypothetical protein
VIPGDWREIYRAGPFDLLVLDGGGVPADPGELLEPGGTVVIDDLTPASAWPPRFEGQVDQARMHWLTHPSMDAAELRLAPDLAALVATRRFPCSCGSCLPGPYFRRAASHVARAACCEAGRAFAALEFGGDVCR